MWRFTSACSELDKHSLDGTIKHVALIIVIIHGVSESRSSLFLLQSKDVMHAETFHAVEQRRVATDNLLVGYYHSHPALSVFQSCEDVVNFRTYHPEDYQIALVADSSLAKADSLEPHELWIGFFAWDAAHNPVKLPPENLVVLQTRSRHSH